MDDSNAKKAAEELNEVARDLWNAGRLNSQARIVERIAEALRAAPPAPISEKNHWEQMTGRADARADQVRDMLVKALKDAHPYIDNHHVRIKIGAALAAAGAI